MLAFRAHMYVWYVVLREAWVVFWIQQQRLLLHLLEQRSGRSLSKLSSSAKTVAATAAKPQSTIAFAPTATESESTASVAFTTALLVANVRMQTCRPNRLVRDALTRSVSRLLSYQQR